MEDVKRILVVSSMTKASKKAIHYGVSLSKKYGTELYVLHVVYHPFGFDLEGWNLPIPSLEEEYKRIIKEAKEELDAVINQEKKKGIDKKKCLRRGRADKGDSESCQGRQYRPHCYAVPFRMADGAFPLRSH